MSAAQLAARKAEIRKWRFLNWNMVVEETKIVWPFMAGWALWFGVCWKIDQSYDRDTIEESKYYQVTKWAKIKHSKYRIEEILAKQSGTFKELTMESYIKFADQLYDAQNWGDKVPEFDLLEYVDGSKPEHQWRKVFYLDTKNGDIVDLNEARTLRVARKSRWMKYNKKLQQDDIEREARAPRVIEHDSSFENEVVQFKMPEGAQQS
eukprot:CAMPEP_0201551320 /NCGR_PEP_ID=MMETSP0173_2-20130828/7515_1 /ASSEMBLY_ACC=CAM_ASM_000268 /TAXON_ID=218659 /ORGANISM="Vexillifera sp., Strain DIVA3 564/2" /LENGTH=206 /DNA_ID=CAMNT_0047961537 /DNA_START=44 /DNA_END=664 /DNA_ORIENTATION=+